MIKKIILIGLATGTLTTSIIAAENHHTLTQQREKVITQYITDLQKADYQDITQLFEKNGFVVSTSRGMVDAKEFFYSFLPDIVSAETERHLDFIAKTDQNRFAARFHFKFKLKDGEEGNGEYIDEFVFTEHSTKLSAVYMFENLKFPSNINSMQK